MTVQPCNPRYKPPVQDIKIIQEHHRTNRLGTVNICTKRSASAFKSCCDISEKRLKRWPAGSVWVAVRGSWFILWAPWTPVVWSQSILFKSRTKWRSNQPSDIAVSTRTSTNYEILFSPPLTTDYLSTESHRDVVYRADLLDVAIWFQFDLPRNCFSSEQETRTTVFLSQKKLQPKSLISKISAETRHIETGSDCLILWPRSCLKKWFWLVAVSKMKHQHGHLPSALYPLFPWFPSASQTIAKYWDIPVWNTVRDQSENACNEWSLH